jgi:phasin
MAYVAMHNFIATQDIPRYDSRHTVIDSSWRHIERLRHNAYEETKMTNTPYEIPAELRDFAEKSVAQARKAFEGFVGAAQKAATTLDSTTSVAQTQAKDFSSKAVTYAEQNINAAFDHAQRLTRAKDVQEVVALQTEFVRSQMANIQAQLKEFGGLIQSVTTPASK